jgi:copper chaperone CopZ
METKQFKTNIMCGSCIAKVTTVLNETFGEKNWEVDTQNPKKVLTVSTEGDNVMDVIKAVEKAGYKAEELVQMWNVIKKAIFLIIIQKLQSLKQFCSK